MCAWWGLDCTAALVEEVFLCAEVCKEGAETFTPFLGHSSALWPRALGKNSPWSAIPTLDAGDPMVYKGFSWKDGVCRGLNSKRSHWQVPGWDTGDMVRMLGGWDAQRSGSLGVGMCRGQDAQG